MVNIDFNINKLFNPNTPFDAELNSDLRTMIIFYIECSSDDSIFWILLTICMFHNETTLIKQ